jgi:hypothetical protein
VEEEEAHEIIFLGQVFQVAPIEKSFESVLTVKNVIILKIEASNVLKSIVCELLLVLNASNNQIDMHPFKLPIEVF